MSDQKSILHTREQGKRVHVLANLGGLVAIAELEKTDPDLLLGALLEVAERLPKLSREARRRLTAQGTNRLEQRATGKRAWTARKIALDLHAVQLSSEQIVRILGLLGSSVPRNRKALPNALSEALRQ